MAATKKLFEDLADSFGLTLRHLDNSEHPSSVHTVAERAVMDAMSLVMTDLHMDNSAFDHNRFELWVDRVRRNGMGR